MDFHIFQATHDGRVQHMGVVPAKDLRHAKRLMSDNPSLRNHTYYLVRQDNFEKVCLA